MCVMRARARTIVFCITDSSVSVSSCVTSLTPDCGSLRSSTDGPRGLGFDGAGGLPGGFCGAVAGGCFSAPRLAFSVVDMCVYIRCEFVWPSRHGLMERARGVVTVATKANESHLPFRVTLNLRRAPITAPKALFVARRLARQQYQQLLLRDDRLFGRFPSRSVRIDLRIREPRRQPLCERL